MCDDLSIELFCQLLPVHEQVGFRHLVVEGQLLLVGGTELRRRVREHILAGMKTEPAFACVLGLEGDPSAALLTLATWSPLRLRHLVEGALRSEQPPAIAVHSGDRSALLPLFRLADDSDMEISGYFTRGVVFVATQRGESVGHVQMLEPIASAPTTWELKSLAVVGLERASGLGRRLVESGIDHARQRGAQRVMLSTSTADTNVLRFYQRIGFRMLRVDRDIFTPAAGYPNDVFVDGVRLLDRVWLDYRC
jgi:ribosomal protein S18 acetylase RimI-like enzyme